jgi:hypothetical protein
MKLLRLGVFSLLFIVTACGLFEPEDGTVVVYGTFTGAIPENVMGVRLVAVFYSPYTNNYAYRDDINAPTMKISDITEAVIWTNEAFKTNHQARGDSTTFMTTFTLRPEDYSIQLQKMLPPPVAPGGGYTYSGMGRDSYMEVEVLPRKTITVRLRGTFD